MADAGPGVSREVLLVAYPEGAVSVDCFEVGEAPVLPLTPGQVLVRNEWMSLGTVYRDQMQSATGIPIPVFTLGEAMWGGTIGTVVASAAPEFARGDLSSPSGVSRPCIPTPQHIENRNAQLSPWLKEGTDFPLRRRGGRVSALPQAMDDLLDGKCSGLALAMLT
jgi:hypothetical protein